MLLPSVRAPRSLSPKPRRVNQALLRTLYRTLTTVCALSPNRLAATATEVLEARGVFLGWKRRCSLCLSFVAL
jgi:hypothetical protein